MVNTNTHLSVNFSPAAVLVIITEDAEWYNKQETWLSDVLFNHTFNESMVMSKKQSCCQL